MRNSQRRYCVGQALFKPLILGIYFRKSDSSSENLAIACADVFRLHPGVPAGRQLGSLSSHWGCKGRYLKCHEFPQHILLIPPRNDDLTLHLYNKSTTNGNLTHFPPPPLFFFPLLTGTTSETLNFGSFLQSKTVSCTIKSNDNLLKVKFPCKKKRI